MNLDLWTPEAFGNEFGKLSSFVLSLTLVAQSTFPCKQIDAFQCTFLYLIVADDWILTDVKFFSQNQKTGEVLRQARTRSTLMGPSPVSLTDIPKKIPHTFLCPTRLITRLP